MPKQLLVSLIALIPALTSAQAPSKQPPAPKIVFVCEHGSAKSVIAAAHFRRLAQERGLNAEVISRGVALDAEIPAGVRNGLRGDGIDVGPMKPAAVTSADLKGATRIISFGPNLAPLADGKVAIEDWSATPSVSEDYQAARTYIVKRLQKLLDDLAKPLR
jgi:protein-tyrosine-phosphatase